MLMEISHLTMAERLDLWKQRKKAAQGAQQTAVASKGHTTTAKGQNTTLQVVPNAQTKLMRKRNRKYINSALSSPQANTPLPKCNPNPKMSFEAQKRTKKENDDPNFSKEDVISFTTSKKSSTSEDVGERHRDSGGSESSESVSVIGKGIQELHINAKNPEKISITTSCHQGQPQEQQQIDATTHEDMAALRAKNAELSKQVRIANHERKEAFKIAQLSIAENEALKFENDVLTQTADELEVQLSQCRMATFEAGEDTEQLKKQAHTIRLLRKKNDEYEARANTMVTEMTEQMTALQDMAMKRIQVSPEEIDTQLPISYLHI